MEKTRRQCILDKTDDLVGRLVYYDRKDDSDLPCGSIEEAIEAGEITRRDIVAAFEAALMRSV